MAQFNSGGPSRAEKLVSLTYALINTPHGYSKRELRKIVDDYQGLNDAAFDRKFDRDKKDLREMGVPVKTLGTGSEERYLIAPESYRLPEVSFTTEEAAVLGLAAQLWKDTDLESFASRANGRLSAGLEDGDHGVRFTEYVPRLHAAGPAFAACLEAVWAHQVVSFEYFDAQGRTSDRTVDAWGIGSRFGNWYLVGLTTTAGTIRMFRLTRILSGIRTGQAHDDTTRRGSPWPRRWAGWIRTSPGNLPRSAVCQGHRLGIAVPGRVHRPGRGTGCASAPIPRPDGVGGGNRQAGSRGARAGAGGAGPGGAPQARRTHWKPNSAPSPTTSWASAATPAARRPPKRWPGTSTLFPTSQATVHPPLGKRPSTSG